ncbi:MAG: hypothetical protein QXU82_00230 [Candidatus Aenigmatarchaeota archaeon]
MRNGTVLAATLFLVILSTAASAILTTVPQWLYTSSDKTIVESGDVAVLRACWNTTKGVEAAALRVSTDQTNFTRVNETPDWSTSYYQMIPCNLTSFAFNTSGYYGTVFWGIEGILIDIPANSSNFTAGYPEFIEYPSPGVLKVGDSKAPQWSGLKQDSDKPLYRDANKLYATLTDNVGLAKVALWTNESGTMAEKEAKTMDTTYKNISYVDINAQGTTIFSMSADITSATVCDPVTGCTFVAQSFVPTESKLSGIKVRLLPIGTAKGNLIVSIYPDPIDMTKPPLGSITYDASLINMNKFYYFDFQLLNLEKEKTYNIVIYGDTDTNVEVYMQETYPEGTAQFSKDGGKSWSSSLTDWNFITYTTKDNPQTFIRSYDAEFSITGQPGATSWKIVGTDLAGNTNETPVMAFTVKSAESCEACPNCTEWSECRQKAKGSHDGTMERVCYKCSAETEYVCKPYNDVQACTISVIQEDADAAIAAAQTAIKESAAANLNTTEAESLLAGAQASYARSDWGAAVMKANAAKAAAEAAQPLPIGINWVLLAGLVVTAMVAAFGILVYTKKIDLKSLMEKLPKVNLPEKRKKEPEKKCVVCGKKTADGYKCKECGKDVCYDDARTYEGDIYCTRCLKKKGII